jgi:acyl-CoA synthetase (NDP forming)
LKARRAGKAIVAFKVGRSEAGARSAISHTGALAGSDAVYDALFRQLQILRAQRFSDLLDIPLALSSGRRMRGRRLAVITSTGGAAGVLADTAGMAGLELPPPDSATAARLNALAIPGASLDRTPIDVTLAGVKPELLRTILDAVLTSPSYDGAALVLGSSVLRDPEAVCTPLRDAFAKTDKPLVGFVSPDAPHVVRALNRAGISTFAAPESCAAALDAMLRVAQMREPELEQPRAAGAVLDGLPRGPLNEAESKHLFARFGIPVTREIIALTPEEAQSTAASFSGEFVLKILSRHVTHKTEAGGVTLEVALGAVSQACARMAATFAKTTGHTPDGFVIQERIRGGVEMLLGARRDPQFGPVILLAMGGTQAELLRDTSLRLAPVSRREAEEMADELKTAALLKGYRGRPPADIGALADAVCAFSELALALGEALIEAEINPLFVLPQGKGVKAGDGVVLLKP